MCVCACACFFCFCFFCIPHLSGVMNLCRDKRRNVHNTIHCNVPGKGLATCRYFLTDDPFLYPSTKYIPSLSFLSVHCSLPKVLGAYTSMCGLGKRKKNTKKKHVSSLDFLCVCLICCRRSEWEAATLFGNGERFPCLSPRASTLAATIVY